MYWLRPVSTVDQACKFILQGLSSFTGVMSNSSGSRFDGSDSHYQITVNEVRNGYLFGASSGGGFGTFYQLRAMKAARLLC